MAAAEGLALQDQTATDGHTYVLHSGFGFSYDNANRVHMPSAGAGGLTYPNITPPSADYYTESVYFVLTHNLEQYPAVCVRLTTSGVNCYQCFYDTLNSQWVLEKQTAGSGTTLGTAAQALTNGLAYTVRIWAIGTAISVYIDSILTIGPITDATWSAAGKPALNNYNPVASTNLTHIHPQSLLVGNADVVLSWAPAFALFGRSRGISVSSGFAP